MYITAFILFGSKKNPSGKRGLIVIQTIHKNKNL
jgi:hypothetical protein